MWSVQDLSWRKPACSSRRVTSRAFLSLSRMILVRILLGMESSMIPRQLLHDDRSPFFGSFTRYPFFHSSGICSVSQIFIRSGWIISVEVWTSAFSASGGIPSGPAALPDFKDWWLCWPRPWLVDWCSALAGLLLVGCQEGLEVGVCWESLGTVLPTLLSLWLHLWWSCYSCLSLVLRGPCSSLTVLLLSHTASLCLFCQLLFLLLLWGRVWSSACPLWCFSWPVSSTPSTGPVDLASVAGLGSGWCRFSAVSSHWWGFRYWLAATLCVV